MGVDDGVTAGSVLIEQRQRHWVRAGIDLAGKPAVVAFDQPGYRSAGRRHVMAAARDA